MSYNKQGPKCTVLGCERRSKRKIFRFPNPKRHFDRFNKWLALTRNPALKKIPPDVIHKREIVICPVHFTDDDYRPTMIGQRLNDTAVPSLFLPPVPEEPEAEEVVCIDLPSPSDPSTVTIEDPFATVEIENKFSSFSSPLPFTFQDSYRETHEEPVTNNVENTEDFNLWNLCRVCLAVSENMVLLETPLFEEKEEAITEITILEAIEKLMSQKLFIHEKWPSEICETCRQLLKQAYGLNILFHHTQDSLKEVFKNHLPEKQPALDHTYVSENFESVDKSGDVDQGNGEEQNVQLESEEKENNFETKSNGVEKIVTNKGISLYINNAKPIKKNKPRKVFPCCLCDRIYTGKKGLIRHLKTCGKNLKLVSCRSCGATASVGRNDDEFLCEGCGSVDTVEAVSKFQKYKNSKILCYICGVTIHSNQKTLHMLRHGEKRFQCEICDKKFRYRTSLKVHLDLHKNIRNHLCNLCGQTFSYRTGLVWHMRKNHTDERNFPCELCEKRFFGRLDLMRHLKTHAKNKQTYSCGFCGKVCLTVGGARLHAVTHTGERPHKCTYCERTFVFRPHWRAHEMSHSGPYECNYCDKTFIAADLLNLHVKQKHKNVDIVK